MLQKILGIIFLTALIAGCEQKTDFEACVEYYQNYAKEMGVSEDFYIQENCSLSKRRF